MRPPVTYETRNPVDQRWPIEDECWCWSFRGLEMPMKPICAEFNPDGMLVMRNVQYSEGLVEEEVWCSTCTHAPRCHEEG